MKSIPSFGSIIFSRVKREANIIVERTKIPRRTPSTISGLFGRDRFDVSKLKKKIISEFLRHISFLKNVYFNRSDLSLINRLAIQ